MVHYQQTMNRRNGLLLKGKRSEYMYMYVYMYTHVCMCICICTCICICICDQLRENIPQLFQNDFLESIKFTKMQTSSDFNFIAQFNRITP